MLQQKHTIAFTLDWWTRLKLLFISFVRFKKKKTVCRFLLSSRAGAFSQQTEIAILSHDKLAAHTRNRFDFSTP